jgi:hypothetical protein
VNRENRLGAYPPFGRAQGPPLREANPKHYVADSPYDVGPTTQGSVVAGFIPAIRMGTVWAGTRPAPTMMGLSTVKKRSVGVYPNHTDGHGLGGHKAHRYRDGSLDRQKRSGGVHPRLDTKGWWWNYEEFYGQL